MLHTLPHTDWRAERNDQATAALETGNIIYFPKLIFSLLPEEMPLLSSPLSNGKAKNISLNTQTQVLQGVQADSAQIELIKNVLHRYAKQSTQLLASLMPQYGAAIQIGRTSFRAVEIFGRKAASYKKDDTRLHVDAFPATPTQGMRILRIFSNIHPNGKPRVWHVGEPFEQVAATFLPHISSPWPGSAQLLQALKITKSRRTHYDHIMLHMHDSMKKNLNYQQSVAHVEVAFPAATSWIVYTDHVSHAALSGQHVLEQTFYLPVAAMHDPSRSPLRILEKLTNKELI